MRVPESLPQEKDRVITDEGPEEPATREVGVRIGARFRDAVKCLG